MAGKKEKCQNEDCIRLLSANQAVCPGCNFKQQKEKKKLAVEYTVRKKVALNPDKQRTELKTHGMELND